MFLIDDEVLKGKNVTVKDINKNKSYFESFFISLKNKEFYGKDIKLVFISIGPDSAIIDKS